MMNNNSINNDNYHLWVERFLNAETSLDEEKELCDFFSRADIPQEACKYREMFAWYGEMSKTGSETITAGREKPVRLIPLRPWQWISVAALFALLLTVGLNLHRPDKAAPDGYIYTSYIIRDGKKISDPEVVEAEISRVRNEVQRRRLEMERRLSTPPSRPNIVIETDNQAEQNFIKASFNL